MIIKLCMMAVLMAVVGTVLSGLGCKYKGVFSVLCAVILLSGLGEGLSRLFSGVLGLSEAAGISDVAACALKIVGVGYVFGISSEVATELGEGGVARTLLLLSKCEMLLIVLPYLNEILSFGMELIK